MLLLCITARMKCFLAFWILFSALLSAAHAQEFSECEAALEKCLDSVLNDGECGPLPVMMSSYPQQIRPTEGYNVQKLRKGVYTVTDGSYIALAIATSRRILVVDSPENGFVKYNTTTGAAIGTRMFDAVVEITNGSKLEAIDLIFTHSHFDHIGSGTLLYNALKAAYPDAKLRVWGSKDTAERIMEATSGRAPVPDRIFFEKSTIKVTNRLVVDLIPINGGHIDGDTIVYIRPNRERPGVAMIVDFVVPGWVPFESFAVATDLGKYLSSHDILLQLDYSIFVGGHLTRIGTKEDVEVNKEYTMDVIAASAKALVDVNMRSDLPPLPPVTDPTSPFFGNLWALFAASNRNMDTLCELEVLEKWGCRLAGAETYVRSHCATATYYNRLDA